MGRLKILVYSAISLMTYLQAINAGETVLSNVLTPSEDDVLSRQSRSYYDDRYGVGRPYDRLEYDRPTRCGRCDDRYDDRDDYDRPRDRYDDDRRHRPSNRIDKNKNYDDEDDRKPGTDRRKTNGTDDGDDDMKSHHDDDKRPSTGRRDRNRDRNRYEDRDRFRPDYYDRFLRDPHRERNYDRPYHDDPYRRPSYDRYPPQDIYDDPYGGYGGGSYGAGYGGGGYSGYKRPVGGYDERFDRGNRYDDIYGGYGPSSGRGPHDSFRPWDETYRGQAGWDAGGRGYYFASGRPDPGAAAAWGRPAYASRPEMSSGWQSAGYRDPYASGGYVPDAGSRQEPAGYGRPSGWHSAGYVPDAAGSRQEPAGYGRPSGWHSAGYVPEAGSRQEPASYGRPSGWHSVSERRPYRDQSGVNSLDTKGTYNQPSRQNTYGQGNRGQSYGQSYGPANGYEQPAGIPGNRGQSYGQGSYGQGSNYGQATGTSSYAQSSTTPGTSYLYQREDEQVTTKIADDATKPPS